MVCLQSIDNSTYRTDQQFGSFPTFFVKRFPYFPCKVNLILIVWGNLLLWVIPARGNVQEINAKWVKQFCQSYGLINVPGTGKLGYI